MVRIVDQFREGVFAGVVELIARYTVHRLGREIWILFVLFNDSLLGIRKRTLKAPDDRHWNDDIFVLVASVRPTQLVGNGPDKVHFCSDIYGGVVPHSVYDFLFYQFNSHLLKYLNTADVLPRLALLGCCRWFGLSILYHKAAKISFITSGFSYCICRSLIAMPLFMSGAAHIAG